MNTQALLLVLGSAGLHASWNFLAKKAQDQVSFMFIMMALTPVIWLVPLVWMLHQGYSFGPWYLPVIGAAFQSVYCLLMGKGYECGDLSQVYPLARGAAPALIAVVAWPLMGEKLTLTGGLGIAAVIAGTLVLNTEQGSDLLNGGAVRSLCRPASRLALMAAVAIAGYHILDKLGSAAAGSAFAYLCVMHAYLVAFLGIITLTQRTPAQIGAEFCSNWKSALTVAIISFVAYFMVVSAMRLAEVAYVASLRNIGILVGVVMGATALREEGLGWRLAGAGCMCLGIAAITLAG